MDYVNLGRTGLRVSRLCLGCLTYGAPERGNHPWTLGEAESRPFIKRALELGITFFDTANIYSDGSSEEIVGRALKDHARRDGIVLATKVHGEMHPDANGKGLSRKHIMAEMTAPIIGASKIHHLDDAVAAIDLELSADEVARLEEAYVPHAVAGLR